MFDGGDDVLLTREEFKVEFCYNDDASVDYAIVCGLPVVKVGKAIWFPRERCHAWYRGDWRLSRARKGQRGGENKDADT